MASLKALAARFPRGYTWMHFLRLEDLDVKLKQDLQDFDPAGTYLDDYQYEANLADASTLLDRCLAYRREYQELAASAILRANDFSLFDSQLEYSKSIEMADWLKREKTAEAAAHQSTAVQFDTFVHNTPLAAGFATQARGAEAAAETAIEGEAARQSLIEKRWRILEDNQRHLKEMYNSQGNSLNYNDRAMRVRYLLRQDFIAATEKTLSAQRGIKSIFACDSDYSWKDSDEPLDELISVVRRLIRNVQSFTQEDMELVALSEIVTNGSNKLNVNLKNITPLDPFRSLISSAGLGNFRVKAVGARLRTKSWPDPSHENQQFIVGNVSVKHKDGPAVTLPHVGVIGPPEGSDFTRSPAVANRPPWVPGTPFDGSNWVITLDEFNHPDNNTSNGALGGLIYSIVFHFIISGRGGKLELKDPVLKEPTSPSSP